MMEWNFTITIKDLEEFTDELANRLHESGCSDGTLCSRNRAAYIVFTRSAATLQDAIHSAVDDIRKAGIDVDQVTIDRNELAPTEIAQWQRSA